MAHDEKDISIMIAGAAGEGIMLTGTMLAKTFLRGGLNVCTNNEYPSVVRGGHNTYQVCASKNEIFSFWGKLDILVALNEESINRHLDELEQNAIIIYDSERTKVSATLPKNVVAVSIPLERLAPERLMRNSVALGAVLALLGSRPELLYGVIMNEIGDRVLAEKNCAAAKSGYEYVIANRISHFKTIELTPAHDKIMFSGNIAVCLAALAAGCKFFAGYPITPASPILHYLSEKRDEFGLVVVQAEDELAAINMCIGASLAGVRTMTATSGPGFSLMAEGLGFAGMVETPLVVAEVQRAGPSTGLPTETEQSDLQFALHISHGEWPRIVIAPGDVEECFYETVNAFNLADKYQTPVIVLIDKYLGECHFSAPVFDANVKIERGLIENNPKIETDYFKRYFSTAVSPRTIPGTPEGMFTATSIEHGEGGHIREDIVTRKKMMDKRMNKLLAACSVPLPKIYGDHKSKILLIGWGSTKGPIRMAQRYLDAEGIKTGFLHIVYLEPFPSEFVGKVLSDAEIVIGIENNSTAQFCNLLREKTSYEIRHRILKYDGRPFEPLQLYREIKSIIQKN